MPAGNQCAVCGAFLPSNSANLRHGFRRFQTTGALPSDLRVSFDEFRDHLISDQGGLDELSRFLRASAACSLTARLARGCT